MKLFRKKTNNTSIERQLHFRLLLVLIAVLMITLLLTNTLSREFSHNYVLHRLENEAENLISALELKEPSLPDVTITGTTKPTLELELDSISDLYQRAFSGHYYLIKTPDAIIRSRSLWDINLPRKLLSKRITSPINIIKGQLLLTYSTKVTLHNQTVRIWVAEDIHPLAHNIKRFNLSIISFLTISFMALWWLQHRTLRNSFRFFEQLRQRVVSLHQGSGQETGFQPPKEIKPLSDEINRLVDQLGQRTERSRSALGNFAHELKRPLQQLRLQQKTLPPEEQEVMAQALDQIQYLLERELKRARIAGRCLPGQSFHPTEDITPLLQVMERIYPAISFKQQISIESSSYESSSYENNTFKKNPHKKDALGIDRDDALELIGNLLDNAAKYASKHVYFTLIAETPDPESNRQKVAFHIEDDGSGVSQDLLDQLTLRGTKLDEASAGHGLGLSICKSICDSYQGELNFSQSELGGLKVSTLFML